MNTLSEALELLGQGIYCLPCQPNSKYLLRSISPRYYLENPPDIGNYLDWFNGTQNNLAILTGNGLTVLDFDSLPDFIIWQSSYGIETRIVESRRGYHAYFWMDTPINHTSELCEIKHDGMPIVAPPSVVNGVEYKVVEDREISRIERGEELGLSPSKERNPTVALINNGTINVYGTLNARVSLPTRRQSGIIDSIKQGFRITDLFPNFYPSGDGKAMSHCPMPAHQNGDRNPSLSLDLITNRAQCLKPGCQLHGRRGNDVIDAYSILHGLNIKQAIAAMASELGL